MYDRPTLAELLDAVRLHLETAVIPAVRGDRQLYFRTLVALNVLKIAGRELQMNAGHARNEWLRLNAVEGADQPMPNSEQALRDALMRRNASLCEDIRSGAYDAHRDRNRFALFEHLKATALDQLTVANPRFLAKLREEDEEPAERDAWHGRM
jgi:hypothetical protein